jgi:type II secretory pathway pseudopilin PulG
MQCSDVMSPLLLNYVGRIRKANAAQQQALSAAAILEQQQQQQQHHQQQQQHHLPIVSPKLRLKFKGASEQLLLLLQRLLSFDPEFRVSAGDAFVELSASPLPSAASPQSRLSQATLGGALTTVSPVSSPSSTARHKHPIDASVEGGHKGDAYAHICPTTDVDVRSDVLCRLVFNMVCSRAEDRERDHAPARRLEPRRVQKTSGAAGGVHAAPVESSC